MALNDEDSEEGSLAERRHRESLDRLLALSDGVIGFAVIALYWVGHRRIFLLIERTDSVLTFLNMALLACIAFMPFPTALLGHHTGSTSVIFYAGTQTV